MAAIQSGDRETGRRLLADLLRVAPENVQAWLWMSDAVDTDERKRDCLLRVLSLDPQNVAARVGLARLAEREWETTATTVTAVTATERPSGGTLTAQRAKAHRFTMAAAAMSLALLLGLALLLFTLAQVVPQASERVSTSIQPALGTATLWCPSCERQDRGLVLSTRIGAGFYRGAHADELPHGTPVAVLRYRWSPLEQRYYALIAAEGKRGWVPETQLRR
jgi:hypothetical protein